MQLALRAAAIAFRRCLIGRVAVGADGKACLLGADGTELLPPEYDSVWLDAGAQYGMARRGGTVADRRAPERVALLVKLATLACGHRPEGVAICEMRRFCGWILAGLTGCDAVLARLNAVVTLDGFRALLEGYLNDLERRGDLEIHPELLPKPTLDTVAHRQARRMAKWM